jgi:transposase
MKNKRRKHDGAFKAKVALEAMKEEKTLAQIAQEYDLHPTQIAEWKRVMTEKIGEIFVVNKREKQEDYEKEKQKMQAKIGELTLCVDFLKKKCLQLGI